MLTDVDVDVDSIIEYSPESPAEYADNVAEAPMQLGNECPPPKVISVCMLCGRQYDLLEDLRGHMIEFHKYRPIEREKSTRRTENLNKAEKGIAKESRVVPVLLDNQQSAEPAADTVEVKPVPFKDFRLLVRRHMSVKCTAFPSCVYRFESHEKLQNHLRCHVEARTTAFKCCCCSQEFNNWRRCSAHIWRVHKLDIDLLKCPVCEFKAPASALVWRHMRVHKKWRARVIRSLKAVKEKRLESQRKLANPAGEEDQPKPVPRKNKYYSEKTCEICERKFVNGKTLSKHIKTVHNKIKPFICNVCGKKTARKASLIIHMRQHTGEKPLHCTSCKFATRDPSVLHKHQMRHNREAAKFKCSLCDYACIQANAYKRHMRLNHKEAYKRIACDQCAFVTVSEAKLEAHKEDHRKGLIVNNEDSMSIRKLQKNEVSTDCFLPLESIDSLPHEPAVDTGGVTIPAPSEDSQFPTHF